MYVEIQRELAKYDNMNDMLPDEVKEGKFNFSLPIKLFIN